MSEEVYGIDKSYANKRAIELIPEDFFWSPIDDLSPFGSDEGDTALAEFRDWRKQNRVVPTIECLKWTIESVGEMDFVDYNQNLLTKEVIKEQIDDPEFDDQQYIFTLDVSVIATGFGQLVDEGVIEAPNKDIIKIAIARQIIWSQLKQEWEHANAYIDNLKVLERALGEA